MGRVTDNIKGLRGELEEIAGPGWEDRLTLVAVSKFAGYGDVREAYGAGLRDFGESRVQELRRKREALSDLEDIRWHLIGPLQTNKVKYVVRGVHLIHSVESTRLLDALQEGCTKRESRVRILLQVNTSSEEQKHGVPPEGLAELVAHARRLNRVEVRGLMTMAPYSGDDLTVRRCFQLLAELAAEHGPAAGNWELSMGMTNDFGVAIQEGSTIIRVGRRLFGEG